MKTKDQLYLELVKRTSQQGISENDIYTAQDLSASLNMSRNTVSQYLNEFVKEKKCIKINSRPVYFFAKEPIEKLWKTNIPQSVFASVEDLKMMQEKDFENLIGYKGSLKEQIEQCQAAASYPGEGLPLLIYGPTGTGKTMIASCMEKYARHQKIITPQARMISVNCSEYANNPELLSDNLFGHVKGAYTGADEESEGLISLANGGILFLDEVHCLKPECQEKLFLFMDKGIFHKIGDNDKWFGSKCHLIFATTENPKTALLKTLLRRIPITICVPSLQERPIVEKHELIFSLFMKESKQLDRKIKISNLAYQTLLDYNYKGNIGELKNVIKATCASVYVKNKEDELNIHLLDLPSYLFDETQSISMKSYDSDTMISIQEGNDKTFSKNHLVTLYEQLLTNFHLYDEEKIDENVFLKCCQSNITEFVDYLFFKDKYQSKTSSEEYLLKMVDKIFSIVINKYSITIPNNQIRVYSKIFIGYVKRDADARVWVSQHEEEVDQFKQLLMEFYPRKYVIADEIIENAALNLDIKMDSYMWIIITLLLSDLSVNNKNQRVGLILCHGYSTASSMADTVNYMLGEHIFDGIDMEMRTSIDKMVTLVDSYLKQKDPIQELMILVDMGSLEDICDRINPLSDCNIGLINFVSTASAIEIGNYLIQGKQVSEIMHLMKNQMKPSFKFIEGKKKQDAIITLCATGFGSAKKISELLLDALPRSIDLQIFPYNFKSLQENGVKDGIFTQYNVKMLIGTLDPEIEEYPYMGIESIVTNEEVELLDELIGKYLNDEELETFKKNLTRDFTLSNVVNQLTILNPEKVMEDVQELVEDLENSLHVKLKTTNKVGLYVHLSCLIERLLIKQGIEYVEGIETIKEQRKEEFEKVRKVFSGVSMRYSVEITDPEIMYILNYFIY